MVGLLPGATHHPGKSAASPGFEELVIHSDNKPIDTLLP